MSLSFSYQQAHPVPTWLEVYLQGTSWTARRSRHGSAWVGIVVPWWWTCVRLFLPVPTLAIQDRRISALWTGKVNGSASAGWVAPDYPASHSMSVSLLSRYVEKLIRRSCGPYASGELATFILCNKLRQQTAVACKQTMCEDHPWQMLPSTRVSPSTKVLLQNGGGFLIPDDGASVLKSIIEVVLRNALCVDLRHYLKQQVKLSIKLAQINKQAWQSEGLDL